MEKEVRFNIKNLASDTFRTKINHNVTLKVSDGNVIANRYQFNSLKDTFLISNVGSMEDSVYIEGCCSTKKMMVYTKGTNIEIPLRLVVIGETDDDEILFCLTDSTLQADCSTPITDPNFQCIGKGLDGSYEEQLKIDKYGVNANVNFKTSWINHDQDSIIELTPNSMNFVIVAGSDLTCNTLPLSRDTFFDPMAIVSELEKMKTEANAIYNPIGVNFIFNHNDIDTIYLNYDIIISTNNSNKVDKKIPRIGSESDAIYSKMLLYQDDYINVAPVRYISSPTSPIGGFAWLGTNYIVMNTAFYTPRTLAHEIGHSQWSLRHCDSDVNYLNDNNNSNTVHTTVDDKNNFMSTQDDGYTYIIRHYQWKKIFSGSYQ